MNKGRKREKLKQADGDFSIFVNVVNITNLSNTPENINAFKKKFLRDMHGWLANRATNKLRENIRWGDA